MKKIILIIGIVLLLFNTFLGLTLSSYEPFNYLLTDLSLLLTMIFIFVLTNSKIDDGFKIGLIVFFIITGIIRFLLFLFISQQWNNNGMLIGTVGIFIFEIICLAVPFIMSKK